MTNRLRHESVNRTLHTSPFFSCLRACVMLSHTTLIGSSVCARNIIHVSCACVFDLSSTLSSHSLFLSPIFYFILLIFHFIFYVGRLGEKSPVHFEE